LYRKYIVLKFFFIYSFLYIFNIFLYIHNVLSVKIRKGDILFLDYNWKDKQYLYIQIVLSRLLQRVKDPVFLKMYDLLEKEIYLPVTLLGGFEQVSDIIN